VDTRRVDRRTDSSDDRGRTGILGRLVVGIIGMVWNVAVFFVVPVLVIDKESPLMRSRPQP